MLGGRKEEVRERKRERERENQGKIETYRTRKTERGMQLHARERQGGKTDQDRDEHKPNKTTTSKRAQNITTLSHAQTEGAHSNWQHAKQGGDK